jgi:7-carboxy-7-deazaguanine synthase
MDVEVKRGKLRVSEIYTSVQGEGMLAGLPTTFVRFAGCNMRCPGWPCDTEHAIYPAIYRHESVWYSPQALVEETPIWPHNICLTGGEPFLQHGGGLKEYVELLLVDGKTVECFSNGSFLYPKWAIDSILFTMDWKLMGSGESETAIDTRIANALQLKPEDTIKFVVCDTQDLLEAETVFEQLQRMGARCQYSIGAAWGKIAARDVVDYVLNKALPFRLNVQMHKYIWKSDKRGV